MENVKFFSYKICSAANPLDIRIPIQEMSGSGQEIKIEIAAYYWISPEKEGDSLKLLKLKINPDYYTGNYDETGTLQPYSIFICPGHTHHELTKVQYSYTYSPAKTDLIIVKGCPSIQIEFYDETDNMEKFWANVEVPIIPKPDNPPFTKTVHKDYPYFICLNMSY